MDQILSVEVDLSVTINLTLISLTLLKTVLHMTNLTLLTTNLTTLEKQTNPNLISYRFHVVFVSSTYLLSRVAEQQRGGPVFHVHGVHLGLLAVGGCGEADLRVRLLQGTGLRLHGVARAHVGKTQRVRGFVFAREQSASTFWRTK